MHAGLMPWAATARPLRLLTLQAGEHLGGVVEHPAAYLADVTGLFQDWQEIGRRHAAQFGRDPAQEKFVADDPAVGQAQLRLQVQAELAACQRVA